MVFIPPNTFTMGTPTNAVNRGTDEGPQTTVTITHGFWIGKHEVTQREYQAVVGSNSSGFPGVLTYSGGHSAPASSLGSCFASSWRASRKDHSAR